MRYKLDPFSPSGVSVDTPVPKQVAPRVVPGPATLSELRDVTTDGATNNQLLSYNTTTGKWQPRTVSGGGGGGIASIVAGTNITVDDTDPDNPIVATADLTATIQDTAGVMIQNSDTIEAVYDAAPTGLIYLDAKTQMSLGSDVDGIRLHNDVDSPDPDMYYGTDGTGVKGFHDLPTGGGDTTAIEAKLGGGAPSIPTIATPILGADGEGTSSWMTAGDLSIATLEQLAEKAEAGDFDAHVADTANPHQVTAAQAGAVAALVAGTNVTIDATDPQNPIVSASGGGGSYTVEEAQDAVGSILINSDTVVFDYDDAGNSIGAAVPVQQSVTSDSGGIKLVNDSDTPGNGKYYGTSGAGTKGYHFLPESVQSVNGDGGPDVVLTQDSIGDGTTYKQYSATEKTKLAGITSGATANDTDANLKARANHTGTQAASTISDFSTAADARITAAVGVSVQAYDADLTTWGAKTAPAGVVVGTTDTQTLTNKTLTAPAISAPTGIVKADVGLGNVDNTSNTTERAATATLTNKTISGSANTITNVPIATGFSGMSAGTFLTATSATAAAATKAVPAGTVVGTTDTQTLTNKTISTADNTIANPYKFRAYRAAAFTTTAATATKIVFDTENFDSNSNFASGTYTAPVAGFYQFNARISLVSSSSVGFIILYKNGSEISRGTLQRANAEYMGLNVSDCIQLAASDTVEVYIFSATALASETGSNQSYFSGFLISRT